MLIYLLTLIDNEGDRQTFTAIYQEYHVQMEKVALRILSEHNDAEDAVQNAWIQVIKTFSQGFLKFPARNCSFGSFPLRRTKR